ncbi:hypothetical protein MTR67_039897 [Solanum verrucosum]|uniref:Reverse transcriptase/retrotransposon-derived protein RNase H-like domain-containing protein n=1 Tax=Solanum verrucosum TaxID=315347 RepID=A0AAF0UI90_SOLVR|nr:hypothetical protein MTR67_039897 [Solanum verrucosum]
MLSKNWIMIDPMKIYVFHDCDRAISVTKIKHFVGLEIYYRWFVKGLFSIAPLLTRLTRLDAPCQWSNEYEERFLKIKEFLTTNPLLTLPAQGEGLAMYYDASIIGLGYDFMHKCRFIAYASRKHKVYECNNHTHHLEFTVVVFMLNILMHYLYRVHYEIFKDHQSLVYS